MGLPRFVTPGMKVPPELTCVGPTVPVGIVPVPTFVSEPPKQELPEQKRPLSEMTPSKVCVVERLLKPTMRFFDPRKKLPPPSIEPAVMPPELSPDMSTEAPEPGTRMRRAWPPVLLSINKIWPANAPPGGVWLIIVALPAVLELRKVIRKLFVM